ncbi:MAG: BT_3928 family protein [Bacteroidota bacterium]
MRYLVAFSRVFVGVLFIISGLIKLNDPVGFSFKLEEYFSAAVLDVPFFEPYALAISILVVIVEVLLGVLLLVGFKPKFTVWSLLAMIVFFTFLTFYSAYYNKVTDCGCFGDAIKLTPWESFTKDMVLLVLILILVKGLKFIKPLFSTILNWTIVGVATVLCIAFCNHVLNHLPSVDFRPYKIGLNITDGMTVPEDAPKPIQEFAWKFNVNGEEKVFVTDGGYPDVAGEFIGVETKVVQEGYEPPIHDFTIEKDGGDFTEHMLNVPKLVMVIAYDLAKSNLDAFSKVKTYTDHALRKGYKVIGMSASGDNESNAIIKEYNLNFDFYFTDMTTLKTIVRSNPAILVLEKGTILQKTHHNDFAALKFKDPENGVFYHPNAMKFDTGLKKQLDSVMVLDQKYRAAHDFDNWGKQMELDSSNMKFVEKIIRARGYPGRSMVGPKTGETAWYVIQHSNKIEKYIDTIELAAKRKELPFRLYAMMLDRYLMQRNTPQIYGTQGSSYFINTPNAISFIWPIKNPDSVNILRKEAGFELSVEENGKRLFGEDFQFKNYSIEEIENLKNAPQ